MAMAPGKKRGSMPEQWTARLTAPYFFMALKHPDAADNGVLSSLFGVSR